MAHPPAFPLTKIVATVGPASEHVDTMARLIEEGVRIVRLNFSHGQFSDYERSLKAMREASERVGTPIAVLGDLSGPKIRILRVQDKKIQLETGDTVAFVEDAKNVHREPGSDVVIIPTTYPDIVREVEPGHRVLIDDGAVRLLAIERTQHPAGPRLVCNVTHGGPISDKKGVNLPDSDLSMPSLTDYDFECVDWAIANQLDYLALSFVRKAEDIRELEAYMRSRGRDNRGLRSHSRLPIIAKIETPQAINDLEAIIDAADGVMVARGDLGVELDLWDVPVIQKQIIKIAHDHGKPVIVATQMLQSMIEQATPTRAEVSDVANAVIDGADAVMLSGETAVGKHPIQAVTYMSRTSTAAESYHGENKIAVNPPQHLRGTKYRTAALAHGVGAILRDLDARYVVMWSELGGGARYLSQNRLAVPILAVSSNRAALRQMSLLFGVQPIYMDRPSDNTSFMYAVDQMLLSKGWADEGDPIVLAKGEPIGTPGVTNQIQIHYVGDVCRIRWHAKEG